MYPSLQIAKASLLEPTGLTDHQLNRLLDSVLTHQVDYADLYFQAYWHEAWILEKSQIKEGSQHLDQGVGIRAVSGEKTGFAYSDELVLPALEQAATAARSIAVRSGGVQPIKTLRPFSSASLYPIVNPLQQMDTEEKIGLLQRIDQLARRADPRIKEVIASLSGSYEIILILSSDGSFAADIRPLVRLNVSVVAHSNKQREQGSFGGGARADFSMFNEAMLEHYANEAVRQTLLALEAKPAPAGMMPVVLGPGWPGVLLHEAVGHGLEGDFNRKGISVFSGRIGQQVASTCCTVVDDGTLPGRRGSLNIDDEGTPTNRTVLIENGILKGYMQDKLNARLMQVQPTGNGRRESYAHLPMPRMTNTYLEPGIHTPEEIIRSVKHGLYAVNFSGGQVDITSGKFVFSTSEAYLIENGKITTPVKGATLIGNGPDVMKKISMVGNNLALDEGVGVCGKEGQSIPVGVGQPTVLVDELTVGGTQIL